MNKQRPSRGKPQKGKSQLRIIGGQWRGRKLTFTPEEGLRPTQDRFRETLFNWLMHNVEGAHCLDLFAGSGALGLEALSRGASDVCFIDSSPQACAQIRQHLATLNSIKGQVKHADALSWVSTHTSAQPFDLVFLDPPFHQHLLGDCCKALEQNNLIHTNSYIYVESEKGHNEQLPDHWQLIKEKQTQTKQLQLFQHK